MSTKRKSYDIAARSRDGSLVIRWGYTGGLIGALESAMAWERHCASCDYLEIHKVREDGTRVFARRVEAFD